MTGALRAQASAHPVTFIFLFLPLSLNFALKQSLENFDKAWRHQQL